MAQPVLIASSILSFFILFGASRISYGTSAMTIIQLLARTGSFRSSPSWGVLLGILLTGLAPTLMAQEKKQKGPELPPPEDHSVETKDGVLIRCTYFGGTAGKKTVPIIMLHGWDEQGAVYQGIAKTLQRLGNVAVLIPDLRGHGRSTTRRYPNGGEEQLKAEDMRKNDIEGMTLDVIAAKKFLMEKNNAGELNIEQLCVVGADVGAIVALNWAAYDWSARQLPAFKQGRDVKALILLSPVRTFRGASVAGALRHPVIRENLSMLVVAGVDDPESSDAKGLFTALKRVRGAPPRESNAELTKQEKIFLQLIGEETLDRRFVADYTQQDLFLVEPPTSLHGTKMLEAPRIGPRVGSAIMGFVGLRLINKETQYSWTDRKGPFSD